MTDTVARTATAEADETAERERLRGELERIGLAIHQPSDPPLFTRTPAGGMRPMHWRRDDLQRYLEELGRVLDLRPGGARRTLRLANPGLPFGTTPTFWASIQYIRPGEVATAHRHTPSAFRFVMQGTGCLTTVHGEQYPMAEGDLVLTPSWAWHDHVHEGDEPMVWLDVLDVSLMRSLDNTFFDPYPEDVQPVSRQARRSAQQFGSGLLRPVGPPPRPATNPLLVYPRAQADAALEAASGLDADPADDVVLEYQDPTSGRSALPSLSMKAQILRPGFTGVRHRHSGSKVYWVVDGAGSTIVDGERFDWGQGDFLAVPSWAEVQHLNEHDAGARLFRVDDTAVMHALGVYHEQVGETA